MTKFSGLIGFADTSETSPGVWEETVIERSYKGDIIRNNIRWNTVDKVNSDVTLNNSFSIVGDPYMFENIGLIRYIKFRGSKWQVTDIDINQRPRIILSVGGIYNG